MWYSIWDDLDLFRDFLKNDTQYSKRHAYPPVNVYESEDTMVFHVVIPGIKPDDVSVTVENDVLTISGDKYNDRHENERYIRTERQFGTFSKSLKLNGKINPESLNAEYKNGILVLTAKKPEHLKPKKIEINVH